MLGMLKHSGVVRIDAGTVSTVVSSDDDEAVAQNTKNVLRTLQELELLISNEVNSWRTLFYLFIFQYILVFLFIFDFHVF